MVKNLLCSAGLALILVGIPARAQEKPAPTFEQHVRPLLKAHCFECHGEGKKLKGGLDLRLRRLMAEGGDSGPSIFPGKPAESLLLKRLHSQEMPPGKKKLSRDEVAQIERWIAAGAATATPEPKEVSAGFLITPEDRAYWAFQPIRKVEAPKVKNSGQARTPVDAFLLAKLEEKALAFSPEADRATLIRRATLDLLGLPPTPDEVEHFLKDSAADAYERLIDRLLASPQYGERWGRHWLDVAGYADSEGYTGEDPVRATAYRYRDYVIRSFNQDRPFDQFVLEQLAGDELVRPPYENLPPAELDKLIATGFLRMAPDGTASPGVDQKLASNQVIADTMQIVSTSLLGLTIHCAQCHNHRYDPIPQTDYYKMRAIFEPALNWKSWRSPAGREVMLFKEPERSKAAEIDKQAVKIEQARSEKLQEYIQQTFEKQLAKVPKEMHEPVRVAFKTPGAKRTPEQQKFFRDHPNLNVNAGTLYLYDAKAAADLDAYVKKAAALRATMPRPDFIRALTEIAGQVPPTHLFERGDHEQPKDALQPAGLTILEPLGLGAIPAKDHGLPTTGRRLAFARMLISGKHPLPPRAWMNRVWMHHFGTGIVATPADFGHLGERPTHPDLLDWLASDFIAGGWRLKRVHKLIMTSTAYRQASTRRPELQKLDPDNRLLGRFSVRRLDAEVLRDAILAVSGKLNPKPFGPPVPVKVDDVGQVVVGIDTRGSDGAPTGKVVPLHGEEFRRSIYIQVRRSKPLGALETFDGPMATPNCELRHASTVATQALLLMNSRFIQEHAEHLTARIGKDVGSDVRAQAAHAWRLVFNSEATARELDEAVIFVDQQTAQLKALANRPANAPAPQLQAMTNFCQALLSANRFLYID